MYYRIADFIADWERENQSTVKIFSCIKEGSQKRKVHENVRSLERLAWHIVQTIAEMGSRAGLFDEDFLEEESVPETMQGITDAYQRWSRELITVIESRWSDASLDEELNMYGEYWKKGKLLSVLITHEAHHRSQMTVVMRLLGLPVPGIYGPSKEEWAGMGMPAME
ncbi:DinB family protein [Arcticibacter tournemirensis]|uniref:Damage-inducible protein DinB n=1 Tax=Arcticibacter tournemirensis TaxID=699437 RepID=A0A4Q0MCY5_9SPHI|nr:DinB family protein [Arcticibacter tournemirensis]RXF71231.1 hypothetical protein EKH83_05935 [Arcticibacter tournemirensis]